MKALIKKIEEVLNKTGSKGQEVLFNSTPNLCKFNLVNFNKNILKILYYYSLSEFGSVYKDIIYFIEKYGNQKKVNFFSDPVLERIFKTAQKVRREIHRFKGFLRFKEVKGKYLYANFKPDYNIILPLAEHFANRMMTEKIIIHDTKRNLAVFCYRNKIYQAEIFKPIPSKTLSEEAISSLWVKYFERLAIRERQNLKLQKQKVPLKYRSFILEFNHRKMIQNNTLATNFDKKS